MSRLFIFPLGYHEDFILRRLAKLGVGSSDVVLVTVCEPYIIGTRRAFESLKARSVELGYSTPKLLILDCSKPWNAISSLMNEVDGIPDLERIFIDLSGGMRVLLVYIVLALLFLRKKFELYVQPESGAFEEIHIPEKIIELIHNPLTEAEKKLLEIIVENPGITIKQLSTTLGRKEKTIANLVSKLRNKGLLQKKTKIHHVHPTPWAQIIIPKKPRDDRSRIH